MKENFKRLLLDTCIYGEMIIDEDIERLKEKCHIKKSLAIYGLFLIRKELRATSKTKSYMGRKLRLDLLSLYDGVVKERILNIEERKVRAVAKKYYEAYRQFGGNHTEREVLADFFIVACAALKRMDLVVSNDHATLLSDSSIKAYSLVNTTLQLHHPDFIDYKKFKAFLLQEYGGD